MSKRWSKKSIRLIKLAEKKFHEEFLEFAENDQVAAGRLLHRLKIACTDFSLHGTILTSGSGEAEIYVFPPWHIVELEGCTSAMCITFDDDLIPITMLWAGDPASNLSELKKLATTFLSNLR